jgi:disulfide bond formation protein DsbB
MYLLPTLNLALAAGSLLLLAVTIALYYDLFITKARRFAPYVEKWFWHLTLALTIGSVVLSLVYSEYFGFIPCSLCWLQRIAIYPQALMSIAAFRIREHAHFSYYGIWLSIFGLLVAIYQYVYQMLPKETQSGFVPCLVDGSGADCAVKVIDEFGFVTFPFVSAVSFAFLIALYLYMRRKSAG